jgi:hypothetical protein
METLLQRHNQLAAYPTTEHMAQSIIKELLVLVQERFRTRPQLGIEIFKEMELARLYRKLPVHSALNYARQRLHSFKHCEFLTTEDCFLLMFDFGLVAHLLDEQARRISVDVP